jgi:hypothetical protein
VVGSLWDNEAASRAGAAFVYRREGGAWVFTQKLLASDAFRDDAFGWRPLIRGNRMFIASHRSFHRGAVYVFELQGAVWVEVQQLTMPGAFPGAAFGLGRSSSPTGTSWISAVTSP